MTLGSLFDGIGGWLIAAKHAGVKPVWASEIDDFPAAVTAYHFPEVKQMGDITKIDPDKLEPVDIVCAGSPCQDLSVAGKRAGLAGERSGLFVDAIRLVRRMRERTGKPRFFVWENVPGAFSSNKGLDFKAVLEEISQAEISMPPGGKWAPAGMVEWDGGSLAWRVIDAQYWGVPQRRKRIFLVADFGGLTAGEILFVEQGLPRDSAESEGEGQEAAGRAGKGIDSAGETLTPWDVQSNRIQSVNGKAAALYGGAGQGTHNGAVFDTRQVVYSFDSKASNSMKSANPYSGCRQVEIAKCLDTTVPDPSKNQGGIAIVNQEELAYTLNTIDRHAVAVDVRNLREIEEVSGTLQAKKTGGYSLNYQNPVRINNNFYTRQSISEFKETGVASALKARDYKDYTDVVTANKSIRRLTPTEAERLQGLPDGYTDIEFNGKPAPDSKRYKALGNGMAQPCADWVIKRIVEAGC